jgi:transcriptional antiterminator NusG
MAEDVSSPDRTAPPDVPQVVEAHPGPPPLAVVPDGLAADTKIDAEPPAPVAGPAEDFHNNPDAPPHAVAPTHALGDAAVAAENGEAIEAGEGEEVESADAGSAAAPPEPVVVSNKHWYVVKVQSGREDTIKEAIERRVRKERLEEFFGQIVIPVEKVTEVKTDKNGKRVTRTKERKLYPGYLMCEVEYNDRILYLFRETSGVGDFVGAHPNNLEKPPTPMSEREVQRMIGPKHEEGVPKPPPPPKMSVGDRVRVMDGTFNGMDGIVKAILESVSKVQVELTIFGRPVAVDLEYYQVEQV